MRKLVLSVAALSVAALSVAIVLAATVTACDGGSTATASSTPTTSAAVVTTLAGKAGSTGSTDGSGAAARFNYPVGIACDAVGNLYVTDHLNLIIRKITPDGQVTTFAGKAGVVGSANGRDGAARYASPVGIATDAASNLYVTEFDNYTIRKITPAGVVTTLAGKAGSTGSANGRGLAARFGGATGIACDAAGNLYVVDSKNDTIRKITPAGQVTTLAGTAGVMGSADGSGAAASFDAPDGIACDAAGNLYVADSGNDTIRKITLAGAVSTLAGKVGTAGSTDGSSTAARFNGPSGIACDAAGNLYVVDSNNCAIRKITPAGVVTTVAGKAGSVGSADGNAAAASFYNPQGIACDKAGNLYVVDTGNDAVRKITLGH